MYFQQKYTSGVEGKLNHTQMKEFVGGTPTLREWLHAVLQTSMK